MPTVFPFSFIPCLQGVKAMNLGFSLNRNDRDCRTILATTLESHNTVSKCEQSVVLTDTYILAWIVYSTTLTNEDVTSFSILTTEQLNTESFAV